MTSTRDNLINAIEKLGWHLTPESVDDFLKENKNLKQNDLTKLALDCDLRNIGAKSLPDLSTGVKPDTIEGPCVLQLVKVRNIGAPKENENSQTAPPFYRLTLTDGISNCNALLIDESNQKLNLNTPPGTKLLLKNSVKIKANLLMLNNTNFQVLGGFVDYLVTKWKANKEMQQHVRVVNLATAPPPWVPFGVKQTNQVDTSKKVFAQTDKQGEDESSEFSQARQAALAEAMEAKLKITKTFAPQTIDKSQIKPESEPTPPPSSVVTQTSAKPTKKQGKGRKGRNFDRDDEDDYKDAKDAVKPKAVTLFDMVKNHLDIDEPEDQKEPTIPQENSQQQQQYQRGGRGGRGRGGRNQGMNRNSAFNNKQQQQQQPKQVYDKDDFSYDLGDTTKVKDLVKIPKTTTTSNENVSQTENKAQEIAQNNQASAQSYNNRPRGNNNNSNNNNNNIRNNNNSDRPNSQYNQARNNNSNNYQNNYNQQQQQQQKPYQQQQPPAQEQFNQPMNYYQNDMPNNQRAYQQPPRQKFINWRIGDECLARHPNDGRLYPVLIQNINYNSNMCLVNFIGYNEYYEFYLNDLVEPNTNQFNYNQYNNNNNNNRNYNNNNNSNRQNRRY